jgi:hypothetical protein
LTELVPLKAFSLVTRTLLALEAVQPVGRLVLPSKSAQITCPALQPLPADELELEELDEELLDEVLLEELLEEELEELELLELDELLDDPPLPPHAARAQDARISGINLRMNCHSLSYCYSVNLMFGLSWLVNANAFEQPHSPCDQAALGPTRKPQPFYRLIVMPNVLGM